ncbi:MAG: OprO/OprP family phosphate-selective porin [Tannerellaceae bacterium]|nr:OprO/OprP family phosphate-selective porin [Tannerellaceae bacterium]
MELNNRIDSLAEETAAIGKVAKSLSKLKVSGYIQTQYQHGQENASLKVGSSNENPEESFNRIGIRRGRIKFTYEENIVSRVFQLDITEKGVGIKDAYLNVKDPWLKTSALRAGVFDRPFGFEISYSSSNRESPERSTVFQTLFPDECDLGAMLILQAAKTSPINFLKLQGGLFAGNGIKVDTDNRKDFIGQLRADKTISNWGAWGLGMSYYNGSVYNPTNELYTMEGNRFVRTEKSKTGSFAKREYVGFDAQFSFLTGAGKTTLRGEYLFGTQPGTAGSSKSPNYSTLPGDDATNALYKRSFTGGYVILIQDLGVSPFSVVLKYDVYDPNTKVKGNEVGVENSNTTKTDLSQNTWGVGALWRVNKNLRLQAYYDINKNEKSDNIKGYGEDRKDNVFTLRLQYKF